MELPKPGWNFYRSHGSQLALECPTENSTWGPYEPILKSALCIANFDLSIMELRCRKPLVLMPSVHSHKHARGTVRLPGEGWVDVSKFSGRYTEVQGAVYGKSCKAFVDRTMAGDRVEPHGRKGGNLGTRCEERRSLELFVMSRDEGLPFVAE